jgi:hypothetical protein
MIYVSSFIFADLGIWELSERYGPCDQKSLQSLGLGGAHTVHLTPYTMTETHANGCDGM